MAGRTPRWLSPLLIVSLLSGCDNVTWEGSTFALERPSPSPLGRTIEADTTADGKPRPTLLPGPVLYMATRDSSGTRLSPVGVITGDTLAPLPSENEIPGFRANFAQTRMAPGTEFVLFARGTRVGSLTAAEQFTDESFCQPRPSVRGPVQLLPEAQGETRFLALDRGNAGEPNYTPYETHTDDYAQRTASINMAGTLIPEVSARWPSSMATSRQDLQAIRLANEGPTDAFATTFLFRDQMAIQEAEAASWSILILGVNGPGGYERGFTWYRQAGRDGRGVPRLFQHADWDGDGEDEILFEVLGEQSRWTAAIDRQGGQWLRIWEDPCGENVAPVSDGRE